MNELKVLTNGLYVSLSSGGLQSDNRLVNTDSYSWKSTSLSYVLTKPGYTQLTVNSGVSETTDDSTVS